VKIGVLGLFTGLALSCQVALAADYIFRDLMANTLPPTACATEKEAVAKAIQPYTISRFSKRFCQSQGYGWHLEAVKDKGRLVCQDCTALDYGKKKCFVADIVVSCKRIKPGSVGLLPGQG